jgi:GntP family gluconate:H+ symporter
VAGLGPTPTVDSFTKGVGLTVGSVGLLIALGAMIGALLADSGGADRIVQTIVERVSPGMLPWAMAGAAALVGIPLFFEVGVVLLVPIVLLVGRRTDVPLLKVGIPALAGLSVLHGFVPPHPGPAGGDLRAEGRPRADAGARPARRHPVRDHRRTDLRLVHQRVRLGPVAGADPR